LVVAEDDETMRRRNLRVVMVGAVLIFLATVFFLVMAAISVKSNDPAALIDTVGQVSGVLVGLGFVMIILGMIGTRPREN
jgi:mannose/fructose/N-acetylgalactosamine-specific phosphotransferase system component IIC